MRTSSAAFDVSPPKHAANAAGALLVLRARQAIELSAAKHAGADELTGGEAASGAGGGDGNVGLHAVMLAQLTLNALVM